MFVRPKDNVYTSDMNNEEGAEKSEDEFDVPAMIEKEVAEKLKNGYVFSDYEG